MKKTAMICVLTILAGLMAGHSGVFAKDMDGTGERKKSETGTDTGNAGQSKSDSGIKDKEGGADWRDPDSEAGKRLDGKQNESDDGIEARLKEYSSIRKKKNDFAFHVGFSIGALGYSVLGPRDSRKDLFEYQYEKDSFTAGFRGGIEALFYIKKRHCLSFGLFYEQRIIQVRLMDLSVISMFTMVPLPLLYYLPLNKYIDKSNIDTNYFSVPVIYRFHIIEEFYIGAGLDIAVLFLAKAKYSIVMFSKKVDYTRRLQPVDLGARIVFGFTMNRVFIELGLGGGILDYDRIPGERHTIYLTGMIGYRI